MRAVAEIVAHAAVKMQIDQSGHGVQTAHIHRIRAHLCGCNPVARDGQSAGFERAVRLIYPQIAKFHNFSSFLEQIAALRQCRLVRYNGNICVQLQDGCRNLRRYRAEERFADGLCLVFARNHQHDAPC